ncbi:MAG: diacylglycerol kinase family lipid kinase [Bacteroidales bacterium]
MQLTENTKLLLVLNPISGNTEYDRLKEMSTDFLRERHVDFQLFETTGDQDEKKIREKLDDLNPEVVLTAGGDGTVNMVASQLLNREVVLGILPTGSANGMATELGIPEALDQALDLMARGATRKIDLLRVEDQYLAVHLSDLGMNARIIRRFDEARIRGFYGYARQFFKEFGNPPTFTCTVYADDEPPKRHKAVMVVLLNTHVYGTGAVINPTGKIDDGQFEIVIIKPYPWYYILRMFVAFFTRQIHRVRHVRTYSCKKARVELNPAQELQVDGEHKGELRTLNAQILPNALHVIYNPDHRQGILQ